jgi:maltooligosyltrehalose trehalohydrolase
MGELNQRFQPERPRVTGVPVETVATSWPLLGAIPQADGSVGFSVWAPAARTVAVRLEGREHQLEPSGDGFFQGSVAAAPGADYRYVLDGAESWPDPCSRFQPEGTRGPSRIVDPAEFRWTDGGWPGLSLEELVIYELHVGAFSPSGTFDEAIGRLAELRELGVTAIELMPIGTFPGTRNWGYDAVYPYAPHPAYGGPAGLARLVDAAHREGLGVILDVVYNHVGPGSEAITAFGPYFTDRVTTLWGDAVDYTERGVREWAIQNAEQWVRDYHVDGLRLDAVHTVYDEGHVHVLSELADRVREANPRTLVTAEIRSGDLRPIAEWDHDAQWADEFHHVLHSLLTGEQDGYYEKYRPSVTELGRQLQRTPPQRLIYCSQNHDQVGNRALGDRPRPDELPIRAAALLFAPQTPLLFMGEEYGEQRPFQFFTDHTDPAIAEATRKGRKREFDKFHAFTREEIPDPQDPQTFVRSKLAPENGDPELRALYSRLLALHRTLPRDVAVDADEEAKVLRLRRGDVELVLNFSDREQDGLPPRGIELRV